VQVGVAGEGVELGGGGVGEEGDAGEAATDEVAVELVAVGAATR